MSYEEILNKKNVVGAGHGKKRVEGSKTDLDSLIVFVREKVDENELDEEDVLPEYYKNELIDVVEIGEVHSEFDMQSKTRPYPQGASISHQNVGAGTAGRIMYKKEEYNVDGSKKAYPVPVQYSNNHVLTDGNSLSDGDVIIQPGSQDGGKKEKSFIVGEEIEFIPLTDKNVIDSAWFELKSYSTASSWHPKKGVTLNKDSVEEGDVVKKLETRTTGVQEGEVISTDAEIKVDFDEDVYKFHDQIITESISSPGDSGATVFKKENGADIGTLFAGSKDVTVINKIDNILDETPLYFKPENVLHSE